MEHNVDSMAKHYVEIINGKPNAWGQFVSPIYGQSHHIMIEMTSLFGSAITQLAINKAMKQ